MQQIICLAGAILCSVECTYSFEIGFTWYLQCLIQPKFWGPFWVSVGPYAAENLSCIGHSVLCGIYQFISNWFWLVPPMFDQMHFGGSFWSPQGPHAAGGPRQTSISAYVRLRHECSCAQILVPCSYDQNALGCCSIRHYDATLDFSAPMTWAIVGEVNKCNQISSADSLS